MHASNRPYSKSIRYRQGKRVSPNRSKLRRYDTFESERLLTRIVNDIVIELDLVPIREDGLERRTSTLSSFFPRNRHFLVRVQECIGILLAGKKKKTSAAATDGLRAYTYGIRDVAQTRAFDQPRQTPIVPEFRGFAAAAAAAVRLWRPFVRLELGEGGVYEREHPLRYHRARRSRDSLKDVCEFEGREK